MLALLAGRADIRPRLEARSFVVCSTYYTMHAGRSNAHAPLDVYCSSRFLVPLPPHPLNSRSRSSALVASSSAAAVVAAAAAADAQILLLHLRTGGRTDERSLPSFLPSFLPLASQPALQSVSQSVNHSSLWLCMILLFRPCARPADRPTDRPLTTDRPWIQYTYSSNSLFLSFFLRFLSVCPRPTRAHSRRGCNRGCGSTSLNPARRLSLRVRAKQSKADLFIVHTCRTRFKCLGCFFSVSGRLHSRHNYSLVWGSG